MSRKKVRAARVDIGPVDDSWGKSRRFITTPAFHKKDAHLNDYANDACATRESDGTPYLRIGCQGHPVATWKKRSGTIFDRMLGTTKPIKPIDSYVKRAPQDVYVDTTGLYVKLAPSARLAIAKQLRDADVQKLRANKAMKAKALATIAAVCARIEKKNFFTPKPAAPTTTSATTTVTL